MIRALLLLFLFFFSFAASAEFSGFFKTQYTDYSSDSFKNDHYLDFNHLISLKEKHRFNNGISFSGSYDANISMHKSDGVFGDLAGLKSHNYRLVDLDSLIVDDDRLTIGQNLNRLSLSYSKDKNAFQLGRIAYGIGASRIVNPLDIWVPYGIYAIDTEEKYGVDALRYKRYFDQMGEMEIVLIATDIDELTDYSAIIDTKFSVKNFDFTVLAAKYYSNSMYGFDFQGDLLTMGLWGELAFNDVDEESNYMRISTGLEHRLNRELIAFVEYHYNGAGTKNQSEYFQNAQSKAYSEGRVYFMAQDYLTLGVNYELTPLTNVTLSSTSNLNDHSNYCSIASAYSVSDSFYLDLGLMKGIYTSKGSEFNSYPDSLYLNTRYYF